MRTCRFSYEINAFSYKKNPLLGILICGYVLDHIFCCPNLLEQALGQPSAFILEGLGVSLAALGQSWVLLGASWAPRGHLLSALGHFLGASQALLVVSWAPFGSLGYLWEVFFRFLIDFGWIWEEFLKGLEKFLEGFGSYGTIQKHTRMVRDRSLT